MAPADIGNVPRYWIRPDARALGRAGHASLRVGPALPGAARAQRPVSHLRHAGQHRARSARAVGRAGHVHRSPHGERDRRTRSRSPCAWTRASRRRRRRSRGSSRCRRACTTTSTARATALDSCARCARRCAMFAGVPRATSTAAIDSLDRVGRRARRRAGADSVAAAAVAGGRRRSPGAIGQLAQLYDALQDADVAPTTQLVAAVQAAQRDVAARSHVGTRSATARGPGAERAAPSGREPRRSSAFVVRCLVGRHGDRRSTPTPHRTNLAWSTTHGTEANGGGGGRQPPRGRLR